jgi:amino acid transporter
MPALFGTALLFVLFTFGGWNEAAYISAEVRGPRLNIARALVWSILIVTGLYVLVNLAYLRGRGLAGMAESKAVAADLIERSTGLGGARAVSLLVVIAAITSMNGTALTGARTAYALGREFSPFRPLGRWQARGDTPVNALLAQGGLALALVPLGAFMRKGFETMVEYTAPVFWLFFFLTGLSLFVLRRREPRVLRPFAVPLYPATPLVFCGTCLYLLYASLVHTGAGALVGMAVLAIGGAVLLLGRQGDF